MNSPLLTGGAYSFNISSVLAECRAYINAIDDFDVQLLGKTVVKGNDISTSIHSFNLKEQLVEFLIRCEEEGAKSKSNLIAYLKEYAELWADKLTRNMQWLDSEIKGTWLKNRHSQLEDRKVRYQRFHDHNYNLIILVRYRAMGLTLPNDFRYYLGLIGLSWIADGVQSEVQKQDSTHMNTAEQVHLTQPQIHIERPRSDFGEFICIEHRVQLLPILVAIYKEQKPKQFGYMLYALATLEILEKGALARHTELHLALTSTFGNVGTRQRLQQLIDELGKADSNDERNIRQHIERIKSHLKIDHPQ